jgi:hypothetical protein
VTHSARLPSDLITQTNPSSTSPLHRNSTHDEAEEDEKRTLTEEIILNTPKVPPPHVMSERTTELETKTTTVPMRRELLLALHQKKLHHRKCFQSQLQISSTDDMR